jgi:(2R)-3-sulfolactate dehydrogenase (NADP+)
MAVRTLDDLHDLTCRVLANSNTAPENAKAVADALVAAEADGMPSHGMSRLVAYAGQAASGKVNGRAAPVLTQPKPSVIQVDACSGFAYPAMNMGLEKAAEVAPDAGVVAIGVGNSHHSGVAGHPVEAMARRGLIALFVCNGPSRSPKAGRSTPRASPQPKRPPAWPAGWYPPVMPKAPHWQ